MKKANTAEEVADALVRNYVGGTASMGDVNRVKERIRDTIIGLGYPPNPYYNEWDWVTRNDTNSYSFMGIDSAVDTLFGIYENDWSMGDHDVLAEAIRQELSGMGVPYAVLYK